jgi:Rieske Fe-S protein
MRHTDRGPDDGRPLPTLQHAHDPGLGDVGTDTASQAAAPDAARRQALKQAACLAGLWAAHGASPAAGNGVVRRHSRALLVNAFGDAIRARSLVPGEAHVFTYPFRATPAFLIALPAAAAKTPLNTEAQQAYEAPAGVGPGGAIVAFSAICAHKLMYPTKQISFIGLRKGRGDEPAQVIHCCGDQSRYDPLRGARVIGGPAQQPLAAVLLEWDAKTDQLHATGTAGGEMFEAFFERYAFKLEMDHGPRARQPVGATSVTLPAASYSRQWQSCSV